MAFFNATGRAGLVLPLLLLLWPWPASAATPEIIVSPQDQRHYELLELPNKLKVLLISDPATDKAAAAMDVRVGSGNDPEQRQGLAHFLEHMLFLGTEKYPEPDAYQAYISARGGSHNAYTAFDHTNYFFDIDKRHLEPALERFAQFFIAPLFTAEYVARERNIVDSEYRSKLRDDGWRNLQAYKRLINPRHPYARFSVGSRETLADRQDSPIRDELVRFYRQHYSANLMNLVVLGKEPLATLERWVRSKFSAIENTGAEALTMAQPLFLPDALPARLDVATIQDERALTLTFPVPALDRYYRTKPEVYISNLLGHEGEESLLSLLKRKGWSNGLSAGQGTPIDQESTFYLTIQLTDAGFEHIPEITSRVFQFIRLVEKQGVTEWLFDEHRQLGDIAFRFQEESAPVSYVSALAKNLTRYPTEDVLRGPYLMDRYEPDLIQQLLASLTPNNVLLTVAAKDIATDRVEPWFETPYRISALTPALLQQWSTDPAEEALALPAPNIFLPDDLATEPLEKVAGKPRLIKEVDTLALWHHQDETYRVPRADFYFSVRSPTASDTARHAALTQLYVALVDDQLNAFAYPARLAGLTYSLYSHLRGFSVRLSGFGDKQTLLLSQLADTLRTPRLVPERFRIVKEQLDRHLRNAATQLPYTRALNELQTLLIQPRWSEEELLAALAPLTVDDLGAFVPEMLGDIHVVALSHGDIQRQEALRLVGILEDTLLAGAKPVDVPRGQIVKLPPDSGLVRRLPVDHQDSALAVYFQGDDVSFPSRARFGLLAQILARGFFHELRTEGQLGYVVFASPMPLLQVPGLVFVVQSPGTDPAALSAHVEGFLENHAKQILAMPDAVFDEHKRGLITRILEKEKNLQERSDRYWSELDNERYEFDSRERLAAAVEDVSKEDLAAFYRHALLSQGRKRLSVQAVGHPHRNALAGGDSESVTRPIVDSRTFKLGKPFFPG